jgi:hypothetical protein
MLNNFNMRSFIVLFSGLEITGHGSPEIFQNLVVLLFTFGRWIYIVIKNTTACCFITAFAVLLNPYSIASCIIAMPDEIEFLIFHSTKMSDENSREGLFICYIKHVTASMLNTV